MKAEVDKLDSNKVVNAVTSMNNLKTKVDLDDGKLKTFCRLEKIKWCSR